jgi:hypothetical protein
MGIVKIWSRWLFHSLHPVKRPMMEIMANRPIMTRSVRGRGPGREFDIAFWQALYLIVGGYAVMVHTEPRYTKDPDVRIEPTADNAGLMIAALAEFGAPTKDMVPSDFVEPNVLFPNRS